MSVRTFYRLMLWLPLVIGGVVAAADTLPPSVLVQLVRASFLYGGLPYAVVALAGTLWIDSRPEAAIRRQALRTPFWMIAAYLPLPILIGVRSGEPAMATIVFVEGAVAIATLGSLYVLAVFSLRAIFYGRFGPTP
jgi:hypothetical protein